MTDFAQQVAALVQEHLDTIRSNLISKGVDADIIADVFGDGEVASPKSLPKRRMLGKNTAKETEVAPARRVATTGNSSLGTENPQYIARDKYPQDYSDGEVVLVVHYTAKSHALFGDFKTTYARFREQVLLKYKNLYSPNGRLVFGFGWILKVPSKLPELKKELKSAGIKFREVEFKDYLAEVTGGKTSTPGVEENDLDAPRQSNAVVKSHTPPKAVKKSTSSKKQPPPPKPKIVKNAWGNFEDEDTGFVFVKLPVGVKGKKTTIAVGYQYSEPEGDETGLATVIPFNDETSECKELGFKPLTADMITKTRRYNAELADELQALWDRDDEDEIW